ncbi:MAG: hypothetical protein ACI4U3_04445 [Traorella sp.]
MIENANDFLSIVILAIFPIMACIYAFANLLRKRRVKRKEKEGKYYPEW